MSETQLRELFARHADMSEPPLSPRFVARSLDAGRRRFRRRRAARAATAGVAAVAALALAATAILGGGTGERPPVEGPARDVLAEPTDAVTLLGRISLASAQRRVDARDDQFVYEKRQFVTPLPPDGEVAGVSESWMSVDGSTTGWHTMPDKRGQMYSGPKPGKPEWSLENASYKYLTTLTTDPDALLAQVRASVAARPGKSGAGTDPDHEAFDLIGHVLNQTMLPPRLGAALYSAAAKIPGVTMIADVTDVAGRPGVAVSRTSALHAHAATWIFDRKTYDFLGASSRRGKVPEDASYAILTRAVVDEIRQTP